LHEAGGVEIDAADSEGGIIGGLYMSWPPGLFSGPGEIEPDRSGIADSGRDAKFYSLTPAGSKRLEVERTEWSRISQAIALVLKTVS